MSVLNRMVTRRPQQMRGPGVVTAMIRLSLAAAVTCCLGTMATAAELYQAQTIVTGQGEANRSIGFAPCLEDVLIKVSGALQLAGDPRLAAYKARAADVVTSYRYHDQMTGLPKGDEQGTRDRPYDLTADFDRGKIDDILAALGLKPWLSHRPVLAVFVEMEQGVRRYVVTSDARQSDLQRDALRAAAAKRGMTIVMPDVAAWTTTNGDGAALAAMPLATLATEATALGAEVTLVGRLVWVDADLGWATEWRLDRQGSSHRWQRRGITFDDAFRQGIGGAAQILSGNGDPAT
jgi:uncharacterized protein